MAMQITTGIVDQRGAFWVRDNKDGTYSVLVDGNTYAISFETYDDESLAVARMDYLGRTVIDPQKFFDKLS